MINFSYRDCSLGNFTPCYPNLMIEVKTLRAFRCDSLIRRVFKCDVTRLISKLADSYAENCCSNIVKSFQLLRPLNFTSWKSALKLVCMVCLQKTRSCRVRTFIFIRILRVIKFLIFTRITSESLSGKIFKPSRYGYKLRNVAFRLVLNSTYISIRVDWTYYLYG